jgi:hypothetical protein
MLRAFFLLHFEKPESRIRRGTGVEKKLDQYFKKFKLGSFEKGKDISRLFLQLLPFQENAIKHARALLSNKSYEKIDWKEVLSDKNGLSTSMNFLIEEIITKNR